MHIFIAGYAGHCGGAETETLHLCDAFVKAGITPHLVPLGEPDKEWREQTDAIGCITHRYSPDIFAGQVVLNLCNGDHLRKLPEIYANGPPKAYIFGDCMARQVYGQDAHRAGHITHFLFQSQYQRNNHLPELEKIAPVTELTGYRPYFSWQRGTEDGLWAPGCPCNKLDGTFNVGRLSRDDYYKFPDAFWKNWQEIRAEKPVHFWVLGYGQNARNRCGEPPSGDTFHVYPAYAMPAADFVSRLDVLIHTTGGSGENWPRVLFEAWASGVVPIFERDTGASEIITDGVDGFLVRSGDEAAERASQIAQDDALRTRLVKAGYETLLREHCSVERSVGPFLPLLEGCPEVTADPMPKRGTLDVSRIRAINDSQNAIVQKSTRFMVAQWHIADGKVHLDRHTHDFPKEDMARALAMLSADLGQPAPAPEKRDGQIKNLCICHWGHSRSVCLARLLHGKGQAAVAIGFASSGGAIAPLSAWADRIFVLQADYAKYVPAEHAAKVVVMDVGPDVWANPYNADLRAKLEGMYAAWEQSQLPRKLTIACQTFPGSPMPEVCRETWIPRARELGIEVLFYSGGGEGQDGDTCSFPVRTDYGGHTERTNALLQWFSQTHPNTWLFDGDDDTLVAPERMLAYLETAEEYCGWDLGAYGSGGAGVLLSPRAVRILADNPLPDPSGWDDIQIGEVLRAHGINLTHDERFRPWCNSDPNDGNEPGPQNAYITGHCKTPARDPYPHRIALMRKAWADLTNRKLTIGVMTFPGSPLANACRETWVPRARELGVEVLFYSGSKKPCCGQPWETRQEGDLLQFAAEPDYAHSCDRMEAFAQWMSQNRPGHWLLGVDDDTLVLPDRLLAMLPSVGEYVGWGCDANHRIGHGGAGYILSPQAVALIAEKGLPPTGHHDIEIGNVMYDSGVVFTHDTRFRPHRNSVPGDDNEPTRKNGYVTCHCKSGAIGDDPHADRIRLMRRIWAEVA
jgi:glycosyltransferase involved in cell wall biosynthesis